MILFCFLFLFSFPFVLLLIFSGIFKWPGVVLPVFASARACFAYVALIRCMALVA